MHEAPNLLRCIEQKSSETFFFLNTKNEWNKLDPEIWRIDSYLGSQKNILSFTEPTENKIFSIYEPVEIKLFNRLRVGFRHLNEDKFRYNFADTANCLCPCSVETESTTHFFLRCRNFTNIGITLMNE